MKLKSYLRGIGIGILVTAAVFVVSGSARKDSTMTDDQVRDRAMELGMIESTTLVEPNRVSSKQEDEDAEAEPEPTIIVDETKSTKEESVDTIDKTNTDDIADEAKAVTIADVNDSITDAETAANKDSKIDSESIDSESMKDSKAEKKVETEPVEKEQLEEETKEVIIVVNSGDGSGTVSRKLYEAGIVADAYEYDKYLMTNGYDRTITVGNHKINVTASKEEIAKNLTSPANK